MDIMVDTEIQAVITNLYHAVNNHSKKEAFVQRVVFKGAPWQKGNKNQIIVFLALWFLTVNQVRR